jgi:predicted RNA methylase
MHRAQDLCSADRDNLKAVDTHFEFGENWASFSKLIGTEQEVQSIDGLRRILGESVRGKSFLDVGSGSGLSALAAAHLGAERILAVDIDPQSVHTTRSLLNSRNLEVQWDVKEASIFDLDSNCIGKFDVVYSWGVLHHTGSMWEAIDRAASLVESKGRLCLAVYLKTPFCQLWKFEKRIYANGSPLYRNTAELLYKSLVSIYLIIKGKNPRTIAREYVKKRGMDWEHDIRDWLGGYPYESASAAEITDYVQRLGFVLERSFHTKPNIGLFGSGCAEYVFRRLSLS